jgi:hypothetical protein
MPLKSQKFGGPGGAQIADAAGGAESLDQSGFAVETGASALVAGDLDAVVREVTEPGRLSVGQRNLACHRNRLQICPPAEINAVAIRILIRIISHRMPEPPMVMKYSNMARSMWVARCAEIRFAGIHQAPKGRPMRFLSKMTARQAIFKAALEDLTSLTFAKSGPRPVTSKSSPEAFLRKFRWAESSRKAAPGTLCFMKEI